MTLVGNLWYELILVYSSVGFFFFFFLLTEDFMDFVESNVKFGIKIGKYPVEEKDVGLFLAVARVLVAVLWLPFTLYLMFKSGGGE